MKRKNITTADEFIDKEFGMVGTPEREQFDRECDTFRLGVLLKEARKKKGMTQEELAEKVGTSKGYISRLENHLNEVRFSTLKRIIEKGLGGKIEISVNY